MGSLITVGSTAYWLCATQATGVPNSVTMAGIFYLTGASTGQAVLVASPTNTSSINGVGLATTTNAWFVCQSFSNFLQFPAASYPALNTPYFVACSADNTKSAGLVLRNLINGKITTTTQTGTSGAFQTQGANWSFGGCGSTNGWGGYTAAAMMTVNSGTRLSLSQLVEWANDPWGFWYPSSSLNLILSSLQAPQGAAAPFKLSPGDTKGDLPPGQLPWRPDSNQVYFYNPTQMFTGKKPVKQDEWPIPSTSVPFRPQFSADQNAQAPFAKPFKEDNWPLPLQPWNKTDLNKSYDLAPTPARLLAGAQPFSQTDWPLSQKFAAEPAQAHQVRQWTWNFNPGQMTTGNKPLFQVEWPNPTPPFRPQFSLDQGNLGPITVRPFFQTDWPLATPPFRPQVGFDQSGQGVRITVTQSPRNQYDWPLPVAPTWQRYGVIYNLANQAGQQPFFQTDWPLPIQPPRQPLSADQGNSTFLTVTVTVPRNQYDWPLPFAALQFNRSLDVAQTLRLNSGQTPFSLTDWPLPIPPFRPQFSSDWAVPYILGTQYPPNPRFDWALPLQPWDRLYGFNRSFDQKSQAPYAKPFLQTEWPLIPGPFQFNRTLDQGSTTWLNTGQVPFHQTEWPLPIQPFRPDFAFMPPAALWLAPVFAPRNQYDWPLPTPPWRLDQNYAQWFNPTQLQTGQKPFALTEWPLPIPAFRPDSTYMPSAPVWLSVVIATPRNQYDWPLPIAPTPLRYGVTYTVNQSPSQTPFNQFDWPLPIPPFRPSFSAEHILATRLSGGAKPFLQTDWPAPSFWVPFRPQVSYEQSVARFLSSGTKPFAQTDWPLPIPNPYGNVTIYTISGMNNPNIYARPPTTVKIEWLIRARRRGRR